MAPSRRFSRSLLQVALSTAASFALLHCGGVDGTTLAPDPGSSDSASDSSDAGRRGRDSGSSSSSDGGASRDSGSRGDGGSTSDGGGGRDGSTTDPAAIVWGLDTTYLYSVDVSTGTVHRAASFTAGCNSLNDLAIDSSGQLYAAENWNGTDGDGGAISYYTPAKITINESAKTATCAPIDSSVVSDQASLGFRAAGDMLGVSFVDSAEVATVDAENATTLKNLFALDTTNANGNDVACTTSGTCWAAIGTGSPPNVVAFADNLTGVATPVWNSTTLCWGMAHAKNAFYCFGADGTITRLDPSTNPATASSLALHMDDASALPTYWSGAASPPN